MSTEEKTVAATMSELAQKVVKKKKVRVHELADPSKVRAAKAARRKQQKISRRKNRHG